MHRVLILLFCLLAVLLGTATAETRGPAKRPAAKEPAAGEAEAKQLSGMSIVGNDEAPKSLYIVPWKSSEMGMETSLNMMLNDRAVPVDREVFLRQLDFYEVSKGK